MAGIPCSVPQTNSPECPGTVASGNPGISEYSIVTLGESESSAEERPERPLPHTIPTRGDGTSEDERRERTYFAARRYGTWAGSRGGRRQGLRGVGIFAQIASIDEIKGRA